LNGAIIIPVKRLAAVWRMAAIALLIGVGFAHGAPALAAKQATYDRFDVALDLQTNGDLYVTETTLVSFSGGSFSNGHRDIPLTRTTGIDHITVAEQTVQGLVPFTETALPDVPDADNRFNAAKTGDSMLVNWHFAASDASQRTFVVSYVVHGVLRVYPAASPPNQQIWWTAVGSDLTKQTPVRASTVTMHFPQALDLGNTHVGEDGTGKAIDYTKDGQTFTFTHASFSAGDSMIVRMIFPPIITGARPPAWQAADDASRAAATHHNQRVALIGTISIVATIMILIGGGLQLYFLWYTRGRDPHTGLIADFLPAPPDDLSPGVAGTLLDERADEQDVVATFLDLARRGVMTMTDAGLNGDEKRATGRDFDLTIATASPALAPYEATIFRAVFGANDAVGTTVRLSGVGKALRASFPKVKEQLYQALVDRELFNRSPEETRARWRSRSRWLTTVFVAAGTVVGFAISWFVTIPCMAATLIAFIAGRLAKSMPRKTGTGAEEAAKWRAFRRYLKDIEKYEHLAEKTSIFERYLAFAVAFGLDSDWVLKFRATGAPLPAWFEGGLQGGPVGQTFTGWGWGWGPNIGPGYGGGGNGGGGGIDLPDVNMPGMPNLQSMSNKAGASVQSGSTGLLGVLNLAGAILEVVSSIACGSSGGSSGGGGGGFD